MALMELDVERLLEELAVALRALCSDPDLAVLLYQPALADGAPVFSTTSSADIPELASIEAARQFVDDRLGGARGPLEPRQLQSENGYSILLDIPFSLLVSRQQALEPQADRRRYAPPPQAILEGGVCVGAGALTPIRTLSRWLGLDGDTQGVDGDPVTQALLRLSMRLLCAAFDLQRALTDPITKLPGRLECDAALALQLALRGDDQQPFAVLLLSPDEFAMVNYRHGRADGDRALRELAERLAGTVRESDRLFRYAGAMLALLLPATAAASVESAARKFQRELAAEPYLDGALELTVTIGAVTVDGPRSDDGAALTLLRRAEQALHRAKLLGDGALVVEALSDAPALASFDPASSIFATDPEKDYRNMRLLWDAVALMSSAGDPAELGERFVARLMDRFWSDRITLFVAGAGSLAVLASRARDGVPEGVDWAPEEADRGLAMAALASGGPERASRPLTVGGTELRIALPLLIASRPLGVLLIAGRDEHLKLGALDLVFLNALANQLAMALDRFALSQATLSDARRENRQLLSELNELRHAMHHAGLVHESPQMDRLMTMLARIAPTDATTLIVGESGTGKEVLARLLHDQSLRSDAPFVTVDCGAIAQSLIEAELFGHRKGAFTGAEDAAEGRVMQANGGTLFLDEIGELPLEVQAKLLRLVQELEITPLGGTESRRVDARIVAATNRDLAAEVRAGRFREDLYYRLQVLTLDVPPLRERQGDVLLLARFFLDKFADLHGRSCTAFSAEAERALLAQPWRGNVRELKHTVLRAVLLCDGSELGVEDLGLENDIAAPALPLEITSQPTVPQTHGKDPEQALRDAFEMLVEQTLADSPATPAPLGRWLQEDLVLAIDKACDGVCRHAARSVGIPESTLRRQLDKIKGSYAAGCAVRAAGWQLLATPLEDYVCNALAGDGTGLLEHTRALLLEIVERRVAGRSAAGAALMGVTPPTYRRWLTQGDRAA